MLRIIHIFLGILLLSSLAYSLPIEDGEFCATTSDNFQFFKGDGFSYRLPNNGNFPNAGDTTQLHWNVIATGGCSVSYQFTGVDILTTNSNMTSGYITINCTNSGGSTTLELSGPIVISLNTTAPFKSYAWDQLAPVIQYRGNPANGSKIYGKFTLELFDAAGRESHPLVSLDYTGDPNGTVVGVNRLGEASDRAWAAFAWQFTPPHASWYKISKIRMSFVVPAGGPASSGIQIRKLDLCTMWPRNHDWYPPGM